MRDALGAYTNRDSTLVCHDAHALSDPGRSSPERYSVRVLVHDKRSVRGVYKGRVLDRRRRDGCIVPRPPRRDEVSVLYLRRARRVRIHPIERVDTHESVDSHLPRRDPQPPAVLPRATAVLGLLLALSSRTKAIHVRIHKAFAECGVSAAFLSHESTRQSIPMDLILHASQDRNFVR